MVVDVGLRCQRRPGTGFERHTRRGRLTFGRAMDIKPKSVRKLATEVRMGFKALNSEQVEKHLV